jgi:hypothetical protein
MSEESSSEDLERDLVIMLRARREGEARRSWRCPGETRLARYAEASLSPRQMLAMVRHLADCEFCRSQLAAMARLFGGQEVHAAIPPIILSRAPRVFPGNPRMAWAAVPLCALLVVTLALWDRGREAPGPEHAKGARSAIMSPPPPPVNATPAVAPEPARFRNRSVPQGLRMLQPREGERVSPMRASLRWSPPPNAAIYEVRVLSVVGDVIWETVTDQQEVRIPPSVLIPGKQYFALVRVRYGDGRDEQARARGFSVAAR